MCLDFDPTVLPSSPLGQALRMLPREGSDKHPCGARRGGGWAAFEMHSWLWLDLPFFGSSKGIDPGTQA